MEFDYTNLFNKFLNQDIKEEPNKEYLELNSKLLAKKEIEQKLVSYLNKHEQKYRIRPTTEDLKKYNNLFQDINKSYYYFGKDDEDLKKVGCYFLYYLPLKVYGNNSPKSIRNDYKSAFLEKLLQASVNENTREELNLCMDLLDTNSSFVILYVNSKPVQVDYAVKKTIPFINARVSCGKPTLILSTERLPYLESAKGIEFRSHNGVDKLSYDYNTPLRSSTTTSNNYYPSQGNFVPQTRMSYGSNNYRDRERSNYSPNTSDGINILKDYGLNNG